MSEHEPSSGLPSHPGHQYLGNQISGDARAHFGDVNNISRDDPLTLLPFATNAPFNSYGRQHEPACLPNTRVDLLQEIYNWANGKEGQDVPCIFWLNGAAGTGKSTIARTVARKYYEEERLGASFFFSRGGGDVSHAGKFFTTIASQLAGGSDILKGYICEAIAKDRNIASKGLRDQWTRLILQPLSKLGVNPLLPPFFIVVDALDECDEDADIRAILQCLVDLNSLPMTRLYICITSRPETPVRLGFRAIPGVLYHNLVLHDIPRSTIDHDILVFFRVKFKELRDIFEDLATEWPGDNTINLLVQRAEGLFIYAATVYRFVKGDDEWPPQDLLDIFLSGGSRSERISEHSVLFTSPTWELDQIYTKILQHSFKKVQRQKDRVTELFKQIVGSLAILSEPLSATALARLLRLPIGLINPRLGHLHSVLNVPKNQRDPIRLHHPSFRDFLLDKDRCGDFWVDGKQAHKALAAGCIQLMSETLKKDICEMQAPGSLATRVESSKVEKCLPSEVRYACLYWVQHLQRGVSQVRDGGEAHRFLQAHLLHWLEALGWMGKASEGIQAILSLEAHVPANESPNLYALIHDTKRFALYNRYTIETAPLQLYCSALVFAPGNSIVRKKFKGCIPDWIQLQPKVQAHWNAALQTLEGHTGSVQSVAFSPDGRQVVSGSYDDTVRLWDAATGALLQTLVGHTSRVNSVAFSPDGRQVVSGSYDRTVRLWDAATGAPLQTLEGHTSSVNSVAFSPDGRKVMSGFDDRTVRLWDAATRALLQTLEGHTSRVNSVAFSPDGRQVMSGSDYRDRTVRLWDAATGALLQTLEGHTDSVNSVAFSPDGRQVMSGSYDRTVRLWDAATGALLQTLEGHTGSVNSVAFSPDGRQVMSGSDFRDRTVRLWDAATGAPLRTLEGHTSSVNSVAFSPDGKQVVSGSDDQTVRLWNVAIGALLQTLEGHTSSVNSVAFSPDGRQVVSGSGDRTVRLWDVATGALLQTLKGHFQSVSSVAFSPDERQVMSGSYDDTVRLWDAAIGVLLQTLEGHTSWVSSVAFSPDGRQVVSGSGDDTVRLWNAATGAPLQTLEGHFDSVNSVAFSPNGRQVVSGSDDGTVRLWDVATGALLQTLKGHFHPVSSVAFSLDGRQVMSGSDDRAVRLWDAATGAPLQKLEANTGSVNSVAFSPNGKLLSTLQVSNHWVVEGDTNILWLPPDYRETSSAATWNGSLAIGHPSGRISFFRFKKGSKLIILN